MQAESDAPGGRVQVVVKGQGVLTEAATSDDILWNMIPIPQDVAYPAIKKVLDERNYQDAKWGGPDHDDAQTEADWIYDIGDYSTRHGVDFVTRMTKVAALAIAAIESEIRKGGCSG